MMSSALLFMLVCLASGMLMIQHYIRLEDVDGVARSLLLDADIQDDAPSRSGEEQRARSWGRVVAWCVGSLAVGSVWFSAKGSLTLLDMPYVGLGAVVGELVVRGKRGKRAQSEMRKLDFFLPLVMERVVMAVGAGLDIIPALAEAARGSNDPISQLFERIVSLAEAGLPVEQAFRSVSQSCPSLAVQHALAHLSLAHKQGGEVIRPLKELSDATQVQYQENVEEEIARLPVKAVLPLVVTFAGLLISFITVPLFQVGAITSKASYVQE